MAKERLTIKQEKFAQGLFAGLSQREAYKQAYPCKNMSDKTIDERACVLAKNDKVMTRLQELRNKLAKRSVWTVEEILRDIKAIALDPEAKRFEKLKALELGGKHLGMFTDKVESTNINHNDDITNLPPDKVRDRIKELNKQLGYE